MIKEWRIFDSQEALKFMSTTLPDESKMFLVKLMAEAKHAIIRKTSKAFEMQ